MNRWGLGIATAVLIALSACGGSGSDSAEQAETAPTSAATPSPTPTPTEEVPRVSEATICRLIFEQDENVLADAADIVTAFVKDPDPTTLDQDELNETIEDLESLAKRAPESLEPHISAQRATLETLADAAADPRSGQQINLETYKSSGLEIATVCGG